MRRDDWLAVRLGRSCFSVDGDDDPAVLEEPGFYQAKVPCDDVARICQLQDAGFRVVDVNVTMRREPGEVGVAATAEVRDADSTERDAVLDLAANHYDVSRFHMDPAIEPAAAVTIKRDWAAAVLDGDRGERMLVGLQGGRVAGFLAVLLGTGARVVDLIAVHGDLRARGVGHALIGHLLRTSDLPVEAGTQVANVGALRFYERLGFGVVGTSYVLHRHVS